MTTQPNSTEALVARVERSWAEFRAALDGLDDQQLTAPGPDDWSVKDHLVHVARWEQYLLATLEGRDGLQALGIDGGSREADVQNAVLHERDAGRTPAEVRLLVAETHDALVTRLRALGPAELQRFAQVIEGNTWEHYEEHRTWIGSLL